MLRLLVPLFRAHAFCLPSLASVREGFLELRSLATSDLNHLSYISSNLVYPSFHTFFHPFIQWRCYPSPPFATRRLVGRCALAVARGTTSAREILTLLWKIRFDAWRSRSICVVPRPKLISSKRERLRKSTRQIGLIYTLDLQCSYTVVRDSETMSPPLTTWII